MVPKPQDPNKGLRYCVDYRYLNKFVVRDSMVLPRVDDLLDSLADAEVISMMDAAAGFWGVPIKKEHRHLTGFNTSRPGNKTADWKQKIKNCRNSGKPPLYTHMLGFARVSGNVFTMLPVCGLVAGS